MNVSTIPNSAASDEAAHGGHAHDSHVAHHFDDADQQFTAARLGMWIFLATEIMFFGGMFGAYTVYRFSLPAAFAAGSHHMNEWLGAANTAVLLVSSFTMVLAVHFAQLDRNSRCMQMLLATMVLGTIFLGVKGYEYADKFHEHLIPGPYFQFADPSGVNPDHVQIFYSLYFAMTGLHAIHMIIGLGLLAYLCFEVWRGRVSSAFYTPVELVGLYWHFVDIVWVFLFPLLYLSR